MSNPSLGTPTPPSTPQTKPGAIDPHDPARYTQQQEREMGVVDDSGRKIQPAASFVMIALAFVGVTAAAVVIVAVIMRMSGGAPGQP